MFVKRIFLSVLCIVCSALSLSAQLLWRVEGAGLSKPSYVMGTFHLAKSAFASHVVGLDKALQSADAVVGEVDMAQVLSSPQTAQQMQQAMLLPKGQTLDQLLQPEQLKQLNAYLEKNLGANLQSPQLAALKGIKPAALTNQLTLMLYMQVEEEFNPQDLFDNYFQQEAKKLGKPVIGLETPLEQINILYASAPLPRQVELLLCLVNNAPYYLDVAKRLTAAFYSQDLPLIQQLTEEKLHNACDATAAEENRLIYGRNADWAAKLPDMMKQQSCFVAVGAAHLPGEKGLLQLLKAKGYKVTPVK